MNRAVKITGWFGLRARNVMDLEKLQKEFKIMIIWDSIAATACSKLAEVDDPNRIIGVCLNARHHVNCWNVLRT